MKTVQRLLPSLGVVVEFFLDPIKKGPAQNEVGFILEEIKIDHQAERFVGMRVEQGEKDGIVVTSLAWKNFVNEKSVTEEAEVRWAIASV